jgi:sugar lactone lactonase YvrE
LFADGTGAAASFYNPYGVAFSPDQTLIAVADTTNNRIRLIAVATGAVSMLAGCGSIGRCFGAFADGIAGDAASFYNPTGVAFSPDQTLIAVADKTNFRIRLVVVATGAVSTLAGSGWSTSGFADGTGAAASFNYPSGVAFSPDQTLIAVADTTNNRIRLIAVATGAVSTLAGSGSAAFADGTGAAASFNEPHGVAFSPDQTLIAVADQYNNRIRLVVVATGAVSALAGSGAYTGAYDTGVGWHGYADGTSAAACVLQRTIWRGLLSRPNPDCGGRTGQQSHPPHLQWEYTRAYCCSHRRAH